MSVEEMVQLFSIEGIGKSNAKFDRAKLLSFNTEALAAAPTKRVLAAFREYLSVHPESPLNRADDVALGKIYYDEEGDADAARGG
jgi:glutamyl/glutaminyl-tRNA synthetase